MKRIVIVDCDIGNRASIRNMLKKIGYDASITREHEKILSSDLIILPGVGAFDAFMSALSNFDLTGTLTEAVLNRKIPILGICLGMQVLFEESEEGDLPGIGWIKGKVSALKNICTDGVKLPHIGWEEVKAKNEPFICENARYYFVHNYYCNPKNRESIIGEILLDQKKIVVAVRNDNIFGVQFHPEKSHRYGFEFFNRFLTYVL